MNDCLVTKLKKFVDNDNLPLFDAIKFRISPAANADSNFDITSDGSIVTFSGVMRSGASSTSSIYTSPVSASGNNSYFFYAYTSDGEDSRNIRIDGFSQIKSLGFNKGLVETFSISAFAAAVNAIFLGLKSAATWMSNIGGNLEEYVEKAFKLGKTTNVKIGGRYIKFNGLNANATGRTGDNYYVEFNDQDYVKVHTAGTIDGAVIGTYNKSTGVWTYA